MAALAVLCQTLPASNWYVAGRTTDSVIGDQLDKLDVVLFLHRVGAPTLIKCRSSA
jgi:hypothetical protein